MHRQRFLLPALVVLTVARYLLLPLTALSEFEQGLLRLAPQETAWSEGLSPLLFAMVKAGTGLLGGNAFGVRCFAPLLIFAASWLLWEVARGLFDNTTAAWALVIFQMTPAVNVAAVTMTLSTTGIAASAGILAALRLALHRNHPFRLQWLLLAAALVLAFLLDWRLLMLAVSAGASLAITARGRRALMRWPVLPALAGGLGIAVTIFVAWNSEHAWTALSPLPQGEPLPFWKKMLLHLPLAFSPLLLLALGWALVESALRRPLSYPVAFLYAFTWALVTLDILCWTGLPWPHCGTGAWLAPSAILLAHQALQSERAPLKKLLWLRASVILLAAVQTCWMMQGGLQKLLGFPW